MRKQDIIDPPEVLKIAQRLFEEAEASGKLKPGSGLAVLVTNRRFKSVTRKTTWHDYLPEARIVYRDRDI